MKKIISLFLFLLTFAFGFSQTHRFIYEFKYKQDSMKSDYTSVYMSLDVNPEDVQFYNYRYVEIDSTNITKGQNSQMWDKTTPVIIRQKNSDKNTNLILMNDFFSVETVDKISWNLHSETKKVTDYTLQKATAKFGGRNWTAWFTKDIPVSEGPYKFRGLPGLIFQINDDKDNFDFTLVKSYNLSATRKIPFFERFYGQKPIKTTESTINKLLMDYYNDPYQSTREEFSRNTNPKTIFSINGVDIKDMSQFKELTESAQKRIREQNNPIEIDKALKYPLK